MELSERLNRLSPSETLAMSQKSNELKAQGVDVINLSVGEPDFNTPEHIKEAAKKAIDENYSRYSPVAGYPALRNAIVAKLKNENGIDFSAAQISCANGAKQSVCNTIMALVNAGDEVIIPALLNRGLTLADAREYNIIGCVEPQKAGKTDGWHDAAFFNMCRPLELVFSNGMDKGELVGIQTGDVTKMTTFEEFYDAYKKQMEYCISLLVNADNAIDVAHAERVPLPFESCMVDDCISRGLSVQEGGAIYNFTGPQGFGIANMADSLYAIRKLVYEDKKVSMEEYKEALAWNYDKGLDEQSVKDISEMILKGMQDGGMNVTEDTAKAVLTTVMRLKPTEEQLRRFTEIHHMIDEVPKYGNAIDDVDYFARDVAYTYTRPMQKYHNPRGGQYQAGLYPVSANVPLGGQTGATPDGRYAHTPVADGVSPSAGKDVKGPTAAATSVSRLDHFIVSNGTLFNQKFHPSALAGREGLEKFVSLIQTFFDQKGMHMQFNVVDRETLLDAQKHPEKYSHLVVRVAGYSALFTTLSRSLQDDIIRRTEQGF